MLVEVERFSKGPSHVLYPSTIQAWQPPYENESISESVRQEMVQTSNDSASSERFRVPRGEQLPNLNLK
jgi:hypothetical protein